MTDAERADLYARVSPPPPARRAAGGMPAPPAAPTAAEADPGLPWAGSPPAGFEEVPPAPAGFADESPEAAANPANPPSAPAAAAPEPDEPPRPKPTADDYVRLVAAMATRTPFAKEYRLWDGAVAVTLRDLAPGEAEAVGAELAARAADGRAVSALDQLVARQQLRLGLQLAEVRAGGDGNNPYPKLADGLSFATAPHARRPGKTEWDNGDPLPPGRSRVAAVEEYVRTAVLADEMLYAACLACLADFNELVRALVSEARTPGFFSPSPPPPTS